MVFTIVVLLSGISGLCMVVGGIVLLYRGTISLSDISKDPALEADLPKLKIKTYSPALGLFVIGLIFIISAAWYSKPPEIAPIRITGKINGPRSASVTIYISSDQWPIEPSSDGSIENVVFPNLEILKVTVVAPGFDPIVRKVKHSGTLVLGEIPIGAPKADVPQVKPENIVTPGGPLPDLSKAGSF
jgi:hypothetical protein